MASWKCVLLILFSGAQTPADCSLWVHEEASEEAPFPDSDALASCIDSLFKRDIAHILLAKDDSKDFREQCGRADLAKLFRTDIFVDCVEDEHFCRFFGKMGTEWPSGNGSDASEFQRYQGRIRRFRLHFCLPCSCKREVIRIVVYLASLLDGSSDSSASYFQLIGDSTKIMVETFEETIPTYLPVERTDLDGFKHMLLQSSKTIIAMERAHAALEAYMALLERAAQLHEDAEELLRSFGIRTGLTGFPISAAAFNRFMIIVHQTLAHGHLSSAVFGPKGSSLVGSETELVEAMAYQSKVLTSRLFIMGAQMGMPEFVKKVLADPQKYGWPIRNRSSVREVFTNVKGRDVPVYHMKNVCVKDLSRETDFYDLGGSIAAGRRLELITVGLDVDSVYELAQRPLDGRFVFTPLAHTKQMVDRMVDSFIVDMAGKSLFWYNGHKISARCPDCANIEHALVDDLLLELIAWHADDASPRQIVLNLHASVGEVSPMAWYESLVSALAGDIPLKTMNTGDVYCFEEVILNLHPCPYLLEGEVLWQSNTFYPGFSLSRVLEWARKRVWVSVDGRSSARSERLPRMNHRSFVLFARQGRSRSVKPRQWLNYEEVASALGAEVIDFVSMNFDEEVLLMRSTEVFITVPGAHHAAALFLRPGAIWVEIHCPDVSHTFYWYRGFQRLVDAMGIHFESVEAVDCPLVGSISTGDVRVLVPFDAHPVRVFAKLRGFELFSGQRLMCSWRFFETMSSGVDEVVAIETVGGRLLAMHRCMQWEADCQSLRQSDVGLDHWDLLRVPLGKWRKHLCAELAGNFATLVDRSKQLPHALYDKNILSPPDLPMRIRRLHTELGVVANAVGVDVNNLIPNGWALRFEAYLEGVSELAEECHAALAVHECTTAPLLPRVCGWVLASSAFARAAECGAQCTSLLPQDVREGELWLQFARSAGDCGSAAHMLVEELHIGGAHLGYIDRQLEMKALSKFKIVNALLDEMHVMTIDDERDFVELAFASLSHEPSTTVCIDVKESHALKLPPFAFVNFVLGHLVAVMSALARSDLLGRAVRLVFTSKTFLCPRSRWLLYYGLISNELPSFHPKCEGDVRISLTLPINMYSIEPELEGEISESMWKDHITTCQLRPLVHSQVTSRFSLYTRPPSDTALSITWLRKASVWILANNESTNDIENDDEVRELLQAHTALFGGSFLETSLDDIPWFQLLTIVATTNVWMGMSGSVFASYEPFLREGTIVVDVMPAMVCHCPHAYCATANRSRDMLWVIVTSAGVSCDLGGAWVAQGFQDVGFWRPRIVWPDWNTWDREQQRGEQHFNPRGLLRGLANPGDGSPADRFRRWAVDSLYNGGRACGGSALQLVS